MFKIDLFARLFYKKSSTYDVISFNWLILYHSKLIVQ